MFVLQSRCANQIVFVIIFQGKSIGRLRWKMLWGARIKIPKIFSRRWCNLNIFRGKLVPPKMDLKFECAIWGDRSSADQRPSPMRLWSRRVGFFYKIRLKDTLSHLVTHSQDLSFFCLRFWSSIWLIFITPFLLSSSLVINLVLFSLQLRCCLCCCYVGRQTGYFLIIKVIVSYLEISIRPCDIEYFSEEWLLGSDYLFSDSLALAFWQCS